MNTKAIKMPEGAAAEYARYACNFFKGCSNSCSYCYNKRWGWGNVPKIKSSFRDENHALDVFEKELEANLPELQKHGMFFSFSTDPMLRPIINFTTEAVMICVKNNVPVKILTKRAEWIEQHGTWSSIISEGENPWYREVKVDKVKKFVAFGFSLTGMDDLESGASTNAERIQAMRRLHEAGFKTFASIEPIIDFETSRIMIRKCIERNNDCCDLFKIGLMSGKKYEQKEVRLFVDLVLINAEISKAKIYFKDSLLKQAGINRADLPANCIDRDFNIWSV